MAPVFWQSSGPLNLEGQTVRDLEIITGIAQSLVEDFDKLDLSAL